MNLRNLAALALVGAFVASAANAATGTWTQIYADKTNGIFVNAINTTLDNFATPPLPTNFPGSRIVMSIRPVSGTAVTNTLVWGTLGAPIGISTSVTLNSATIVGPNTVVDSMTTVTTLNSYHDVGYSFRNTVGQLVNMRAIEIKQ